MNARSYRFYQLGLAAIGLFTVVLVVMLLSQASAVKKDNLTAQKAQEVADKLNNYTSAHNSVPASLDVLKVKDVPNTITYTKLSSTSYKFCMTYAAASSNFATDGISALSGTGLGSLDQPTSPGYSTYDTSYLYVSSDHKKGENCQTIKLYSYDLLNSGSSGSGSLFSSPSQSNPSSTDPYAVCDSVPLNDTAGYDACIQKVQTQQSQTQFN